MKPTIKVLTLCCLAGVLWAGWPTVAEAQRLRTEFRRPVPVAPSRVIISPGMTGRVGYIDTSWQNSPYVYWLIHHHHPYPWPYPYPYPYPYPVPVPYYPGYDGYTTGATAIPDYYGGTSDPANPYSDQPTTAVLPQVSGNNAVIHVKVPVALAEVTFNEQKTYSTGINRVFTTPELEPGKTHTYTVTASWSEGGLPRNEARAVQVTAGQTVTVDFTRKE